MWKTTHQEPNHSHPKQVNKWQRFVYFGQDNGTAAELNSNLSRKPQFVQQNTSRAELPPTQLPYFWFKMAEQHICSSEGFVKWISDGKNEKHGEEEKGEVRAQRWNTHHLLSWMYQSIRHQLAPADIHHMTGSVVVKVIDYVLMKCYLCQSRHGCRVIWGSCLCSQTGV